MFCLIRVHLSCLLVSEAQPTHLLSELRCNRQQAAEACFLQTHKQVSHDANLQINALKTLLTKDTN